MTSSNTYNFFLDNAGIVNEAFARCGIRPTSLEREHFFSATRSLNLALQSFSNRGVNLWQVELISVPLIQGTAAYQLPSNLVNILDAYIETYSLQTSVSGTPNFSTVANSNVVTVNIVQNNLVVNNWINIVVPVTIGGIVLQGLYQVNTVLNANQFTIQAANNATSTVNNGGVLPVFTTTTGSPTVTVAFANHGLAVGNTFTVQAATTCGGLTLTGPYIVATAPDANHFTFVFGSNATANDTETENSGNQVITTQYNSGDPQDRILTPISRTDYAAQPDKIQQAPPTTFWYDRTAPISTITMWPVPDGNGPYVFFAYGMRRIQDAAATGGQTADVPYRFIDALCAEMAKRLARKYAPALVQALTLEAQESWGFAAEEDRERVQTFIVPDTSGYFRN